MGCWALLVGAAQIEVRGLMVMSGTGHWRIVQVAAGGGCYRVSELGGWPDDARYVPLPNHPKPCSLQSFVANSMLGGSQRGFFPLRAQNAGDQDRVSQWAILKLVEQFGCIWRDLDRRGDRVRPESAEAVPPGMATVFRRLPACGPNGAASPIAVDAPPFLKLPTEAEFVLEPTLGKPPAILAQMQIRPYRPEDLAGVLALLRQEPKVFDQHDLEEAAEELRLATRPDRLPQPLIPESGQRYARADYWVLVSGRDPRDYVLGVIGAIQFYGVEDQWWFGYLCRHGSILTEVLLRRGRDLGFSHALVWTDPKLVETVDWYRDRAGFKQKDRRPLEVRTGQPWVTFEHDVLPGPEA